MFEFVKSQSLKINLSEDDKKQICSAEYIAKVVNDKGILAYDICLDGIIIGFALLRDYEEGLFLWDYAIDSNYQNKGYGYQALVELIEKLKTENDIHYFTTTYTWGNLHAKHIYEKVGFIETDIVDEDGIHEVNMELKV